jgi:hypothetical protein
MKKFLLPIAVVLAFSFAALAQQSNSSSGTQSSQSQTSTESNPSQSTESNPQAGGETSMGKHAKGGEHTLTGCLEKNPSGSGYLLTTAKHKNGIAVESSQDISAHVGHEVRLTGTWESGTSTSTQSAQGGGSRMFNATNLEHISDSCPASMK